MCEDFFFRYGQWGDAPAPPIDEVPLLVVVTWRGVEVEPSPVLPEVVCLRFIVLVSGDPRVVKQDQPFDGGDALRGLTDGGG